jgi:hypothetical protein
MDTFRAGASVMICDLEAFRRAGGTPPSRGIVRADAGIPQGKRKLALEVLHPVHNWFTERRPIKGHLEAAALLAELR